MVAATISAAQISADAAPAASSAMPATTTTMAATDSNLRSSPRSTMPPIAASSAPPPRAIGYASEKSPCAYAHPSATRYTMWTQADNPAHTHAPAGTPPVTTSNTAPAAPAMRNVPHKAMKGSPLRLANRFHPACRTAAVKAKTVAWNTVRSARGLRGPVAWHGWPAPDAAVLAEHVGQQPIGVLRAPEQHLLRQRQHDGGVRRRRAPRRVGREIEAQPLTVSELHIGMAVRSQRRKVSTFQRTVPRPFHRHLSQQVPAPVELPVRRGAPPPGRLAAEERSERKPVALR